MTNEEQIKWMEDNGVLTGTKAYGYESYADIDYVITNDEARTISLNFANAVYDYDQVQEFVNIKMPPNIDVIVVPDIDTKKLWKMTTRIITGIINSGEEIKEFLKDKEIRRSIWISIWNSIEQ